MPILFIVRNSIFTVSITDETDYWVNICVNIMINSVASEIQ